MTDLSPKLVAAFNDFLDQDPRFNITASETIRGNLKDYIDAVIRSMFPDPVSGTKEVIRRFLTVTSMDNGRSCRTKFQDSEAVIAELKAIHPFNPDSMYEALCRIAQCWNLTTPFISFGGNVGSYSGDTQASDRYTTMMLAPVADAIFFKGINIKALPKMVGGSGHVEPKYFVPAIPTSLLLPNYTIGFGYQSKTVPLNFGAICDLVPLYVAHREKSPHTAFDCSLYPEKFIPDFPTPNILTNYHELISEYKKGNFKAQIRMDGLVDLKADKIIIRTLPYGVQFSTLLETILGDGKQKVGVYTKGSIYDKKIASAVNLSSPVADEARLVIDLKKTANVFDVWKDLLKIISISGSYVPNQNYLIPDTGDMAELSYSNLLSIWFTARRSLVLSTKRKQQQALIKQLHLTQAQYIVIDHMDEVISIIRNNSVPEARLKLEERFKVTADQAKALIDQKLEVLSKTSGPELKAQIESLTARIQAVGESMGRIGEEISDTAIQIKKEFDKGPKTHIPNYIGCVYVEGGFIQFEDTNELPDIAKDFPKGKFVVKLYDGHHILGFDGSASNDEATHKYGFNSVLSYRYDPFANTGKTFTLIVKDGCIACGDGTILSTDPGVFQVRRNCATLTSKGDIEIIDVKESFTVRKGITKGVKSDIILAYQEPVKTYYLVSINDKDQNVVHIQRVEPEATKVVVSPLGNSIIDYVSSHKNHVVNLPSDFTSRLAVRAVHIGNLEKLLGDKSQVRIDLSTQKSKRDPNLVYL